MYIQIREKNGFPESLECLRFSPFLLYDRSGNCGKLSFSMEAKKLKSSQGRRNFLMFLKGMGQGRGSEVCKEADRPHHIGMSQGGRMAHSYLLLTIFRKKQIF